MEQVESKEYSWKWVTADELLSHGACELVYAQAYSTQANYEATIYDGENTSGDVIVKFFSSTKRNLPFSPKVPVYCGRGLYVDMRSKIEGMFVQWRELGHKGGGS